MYTPAAATSWRAGLVGSKSAVRLAPGFSKIRCLCVALSLLGTSTLPAQPVVVEALTIKRNLDPNQGPDILISPDGRRAAVVVNQGSRKAVELDGRPGPAFARIESMKFTADSSKLIYVAERGSNRVLVTADARGVTESAEYSRVQGIVSPVGNSIATLGTLPEDVSKPFQLRSFFVSVDGKECPVDHAYVEEQSFIFSKNGKHHAYKVLRRPPSSPNTQKYILVIDGVAGPAVEQFAGNGIFCKVEGKDALVIAVQDRDSAVWMAQFFDGSHKLLPGSFPPHLADRMRYATPDGEHFAYLSHRVTTAPASFGALGTAEYEVWVDGKSVAKHTAPAIQRDYLSVDNLMLSPDGKRIAYTVADKPQMLFPYVDRKRADFDYAHASNFTFSADGKRLAYLAQSKSREMFVVIDGQEMGPYSGATDLRFTADGKHATYVVGQFNEMKFAVDGQLIEVDRNFNTLRELNDGTLYLETDGKYRPNAFSILKDGAVTSLPLEGKPVRAIDGSREYFPFVPGTLGIPAALTTIDPKLLQPIPVRGSNSEYDDAQEAATFAYGHVVKLSRAYGRTPVVYVDGKPAVAYSYTRTAPILVDQGDGKVSFFAIKDDTFVRIILDVKQLAALPAVPLAHEGMKFPEASLRPKQTRPAAEVIPAAVTKTTWTETETLTFAAAPAKPVVAAPATPAVKTPAPKPVHKPATQASAPVAPPAAMPATTPSFPASLPIPPTGNQKIDEVANTAKAVGNVAKELGKGLSGFLKKKKDKEAEKEAGKEEGK